MEKEKLDNFILSYKKCELQIKLNNLLEKAQVNLERTGKLDPFVKLVGAVMREDKEEAMRIIEHELKNVGRKQWKKKN